MRVTIRRELTVAELVEGIHERYGDREALEAHLEEHPDDWDARVALHDLEEYATRDPDKRIEDAREIVLPNDALDELTSRRLNLLFALQRADGEVEGIRQLSRIVERDVKNVSEDVEALRTLGLVEVREQGPGRAHLVSLPGERIDLHLVEAS